MKTNLLPSTFIIFVVARGITMIQDVWGNIYRLWDAWSARKGENGTAVVTHFLWRTH